MVIGLAGSLGLLGFFKYSDFAIAQFNILGNMIDLNSEIPLRCSNKKLSSLFFQSYVFLVLEGASNSGLVNIRYIARIHVAGKQ